MNDDENLKLNSVQLSIYEGLSNIGEEIASFYLDGIKILNDENIKTKANLLGHIAREIDGGLRDIYKLNIELDKCELCNSVISKSDYRDSIAHTLGIDREDEFVKKWHKVVKKFHSYAHRHGAWKKPRESNKMISIWSKYEEILKKLVGSYYSLISRIERILEIDKPTDAQKGVLINSIKNPALELDFFKKVKSIAWFTPLKEKGYFSSENAPIPQKADNDGYTVPYWNVLDYLERVSQQISKPENSVYIPELVKIIIDVSEDGHPDNYRTWWYFAKIICNLPNESITDEIIDLIPTWLGSQFDSSLPGKEIGVGLLSKFLGSVELADIKKAERIINYFTGVRIIPPEQRNELYTTDKENYISLIEPYWLKEAFNKHSEIIAKKCSNKVIFDLKDKIEKVLSKISYENTIEYDKRTLIFSLKVEKDKYSIKIFEFKELISREEKFEFVRNLRMEKYVSGEDIKEKLFKFEIEKTVNEFILIAGSKVLTEYTNFKSREPELNNFLMYLYFGLYDRGTYQSLYDNNILNIYNTLSTFNTIIKKILLIRAKERQDETKEILQLFLECKYLYLRKFAYYIIGNYFEKYCSLFWDYLYKDSDNVFLKSIYFGDEIKHIFLSAKDIDDDKSELLERKIEEESVLLSSINKDENFIKSWKQRNFKALSHIEYFNEKYLELKAETGIDPELGPAIHIGESRTGPGPSPLSIEDIMKKSNEDLALFLNDFKAIDPWDGPTKEGLSNIIRSIAKSTPEKFTNNLLPFINTSHKYIYDMFWGFVDAWNNKQYFEWGYLLEFIKRYIKRPGFWERKLETKGELINVAQSWVVSVIGALIETGTKEDNNAFPMQLNDTASKIISIILNNMKPDDKQETLDPVSHALNSPYGKTLAALINLSLRDARITYKDDKKKKEKWRNELKILYTNQLDKGINESYTLLGQYLPNFFYLDEEWSEKQVKDMEAKFECNNSQWVFFINGYLFINRVYDNIYRKMYNHYLYALDFNFSDNNIIRQQVQHIAIGYLRGIDSVLDQPLFNTVLEKWNHEQIIELIQFFWMQRNYIAESVESNEMQNKGYRDKILNFWGQIYNHYKDISSDELNEEDKKILSAVTKLALYLFHIDEVSFNWLMLSTPYIKFDFNVPFFLEYLNRLKDKDYDLIKTAHFVADLYLNLLEYNIPEYDKKHIYSIVEYLLDFSKENDLSEIKSKALEICNIYGPSGIRGDDGREFLRDLYDKYND